MSGCFRQLYIEAREGRKKADSLVAADMAAYNACWDEVRAGPGAANTLDQIRRLCAAAKAKSGRCYTDEPKQRLTGVDTKAGTRSTAKENANYAVMLRLLQLSGALNGVVQHLGRRWSGEVFLAWA